MAEKQQAIIAVEKVSKIFKLPHEKSTSLKSLFVGIFKKRKKGYEMQRALDGINFEVQSGEFFGIVGRNGSGKSTLLKMLAGIYVPTKGSITINGKLTPFIELGVGFNPELTGRENVFLNGALLGFNRKEMQVMYDEIVEFAELERFMDQKLKNYSSGMQVRLAFSIAIRAQSDILLIDEVLAVGDEAFQRKCFEYFAELKRLNKTVILVTHDMSAVQRLCTRAMLIESGKVTEIGKPSVVARKYQKLNLPDEKEVATERRSQNKALAVVVNDKNKNTNVGIEPIKLSVTVCPDKDISDFFLGLTIQRATGEYVYWYTTEAKGELGDLLKANKKATLDLNMQNIFGDGEYIINLSLKSNDRTKEYYVHEDAGRFKVAGRNGAHGWMFHPEVTISAEK